MSTRLVLKAMELLYPTTDLLTYDEQFELIRYKWLRTRQNYASLYSVNPFVLYSPFYEQCINCFAQHLPYIVKRRKLPDTVTILDVPAAQVPGDYRDEIICLLQQGVEVYIGYMELSLTPHDGKWCICDNSHRSDATGLTADQIDLVGHGFFLDKMEDILSKRKRVQPECYIRKYGQQKFDECAERARIRANNPAFDNYLLAIKRQMHRSFMGTYRAISDYYGPKPAIAYSPPYFYYPVFCALFELIRDGYFVTKHRALSIIARCDTNVMERCALFSYLLIAERADGDMPVVEDWANAFTLAFYIFDRR